MCGIAGRFDYKTGAPASREELRRMAYRMRHRGPDGEGFHVDGALGFAHRRLAIIDLEGGVQPMSTPEGDLTIVFNGEIFNYVELFEELRGRGHVPRTQSDTEAILLAYREWGLDFPARLNGMFAIGLWDAREKRLVLVRDRMGVKPLYTADTPDGILFASEIKALRGSPGVDTTIDLQSLDEYMTLGYVVHPRSMVRGVRKLEPGTMMVIDGPSRTVEHRRFWSLRFDPDPRPSEAEWAERVRTLFDDAVRIRLRSDVPLGVLLSGGVDSTAIATTIARLGGGGAKGMDSFCIGVDVPGAITEFEWARTVAKRIGTRHHEERLSAEAHGQVLLEAAQLLDEPLAESMVGQLLAICRLVRKHVTVVLSGEGSDETWFGYTAYRTMYAIELAQRRIPPPVLGRLPGLLDRAAALPVSSKVAKYLRLLGEPLEPRYLGLNYFDTAVKDSLYTAELRRELHGRDAREALRRLYDDAGGPEPISRMAAVDCRAWLVDNTLLRSDLMSMAASVELRVPFMDYRLVELAAKIPAKHKVKPHTQKWILKKALSDRLPIEVQRRKKVGFPTPLIELFRGPWSRTAEETLRSPSRTTEPLFDRGRLSRMIDEHRAAKNDWSRQLFQVLMIEYWAREAERLDAEALAVTDANPVSVGAV
jgi:asparagine synthase (glutamine-hydrolysing)